MRVNKNRSHIEAEFESKDPTEMGDNMISSEDDGGQEAIVTLAVYHEPTTTSASGGRDIERHGDIPAPRKCTMSSDAVGK